MAAILELPLFLVFLVSNRTNPPTRSIRSIIGSSPRALHMGTRGLGYTAGVKGAEESVPLGASRRRALMDDY